jgi:pyruvate/oxaloacetate carboxyltransferase
MNGETWPKEEQRMCNGASGKVPVTVNNGDSFDLSAELQKEANVAIDVADHLTTQSLDYARNELGHNSGTAHLGNVVQLAAAHLKCASAVLAARMLDAALRDAVPEIAGAIEGVGTDIGAGLTEGCQGACEGRSCRRGT